MTGTPHSDPPLRVMTWDFVPEEDEAVIVGDEHFRVRKRVTRTDPSDGTVTVWLDPVTP